MIDRKDKAVDALKLLSSLNSFYLMNSCSAEGGVFMKVFGGLYENKQRRKNTKEKEEAEAKRRSLPSPLVLCFSLLISLFSSQKPK